MKYHSKKLLFYFRGASYTYLKTWHGAIVPWSYPQSIVAAAVFHLWVRDGISVVPLRHSHQENCRVQRTPWRLHSDNSYYTNCWGQALGLLVRLGYIHYCTSTSRLSTGILPVTLPTYSGESTHLEVGFPLRCFQRLSAPHLATQRLPLAR